MAAANEQENTSPGVLARKDRAKLIIQDSLAYARSLTAEEINDLLLSIAQKTNPQTPRNHEH